jgi:O-glycosyl hydrolase
MTLHSADTRRGSIALGAVALVLAAWLAHSSVPGLAQTGGALVTVWLTTPDKLNLMAPQGGVVFQADAGQNATTIDVDSRTTFQQVDGFGASFTDSSAWLVYTKLTPAARNELMSRLFDPVAGIGLSYLRQPMGATDFALSSYTYDDMPAGQTDSSLTHFSINHDRAYILPLLKQARLINNQLRIMATPWSPPAWMKSTQSMIGGTLNSSAMSPLAGYFVKFLQAYQTEGVPIDRITVQNEPHFAPGGYPGMFMEWDQQAAFVRDYLGPALANASLTTGIAVWDHNWDEPNYPLNILADAGAAQYVSGSAFHCYAGTPAAMTTVHDFNPGKDLYLTECTASAARGSWADILKSDLETLIIGGTRNWARTVLKWNIALDANHGPTNGGCATCSGLVTIDQASGAVTYNVDYYTIGHASKFVMPGARRIASNTFGPGSIEDVAFKNPDGSIALIVLNADSVPRTFKVRVGQQSFLYQLPASGVTTFTWQDSTTWTNQPPAVALTAPANGAPYVAPAVMTLNATASDPDGYITSVKFFAGASLLGSSVRPPYTTTLSAVPAGTYNLTAVAVDNLGGTSTSTPVSVTVSPPSVGSTPFSGAPMAVPGTIEAEQFDNGGEGVAYHDLSAGNSGGQYRATDVDIEATTDVNGGYDVGWIYPGEWLNYTINVTTAGTYTLDARVACPGAGGTFHVEINGVALTGALTIPNTGGWQAWTSVSTPIQLAAGTQRLRLVFDTVGPSGAVGNVNYLRVSVPVSGPTPFSGTPVTVPGTIEAEQFDNGGEGVAYHDLTAGNSGGQYRTTDVDIESTTDVNGGYDVGWIYPGEWLNYTINVTTAGAYTLDARVACPGAGGTFHIEISGVAVTGAITIPNTGGWQAWTTVSAPVQLTAGTKILRLVFDTVGPSGAVGNVNYLRVRAPTNASTPFSGTPAAVPGTIEAEQFDNGGEGVAYHDLGAGNTGGQYRATDVDIEATTDVNGGYDIGWIGPGEWLNYTIAVTAAGAYTLDARVAASGAGGTFHVEINGVALTGALTIPNTGGWQAWTTVSAPIQLTAGTQILRLVFDTAGPGGAVGNVNYLRVRTQ